MGFHRMQSAARSLCKKVEIGFLRFLFFYHSVEASQPIGQSRLRAFNCLPSLSPPIITKDIRCISVGTFVPGRATNRLFSLFSNAKACFRDPKDCKVFSKAMIRPPISRIHGCLFNAQAAFSRSLSYGIGVCKPIYIRPKDCRCIALIHHASFSVFFQKKGSVSIGKEDTKLECHFLSE